MKLLCASYDGWTAVESAYSTSRRHAHTYLGGETRVLISGLEQLAPVRVELGVEEEAVVSEQGLELHLFLFQLSKLYRRGGVWSLFLLPQDAGARKAPMTHGLPEGRARARAEAA